MDKKANFFEAPKGLDVIMVVLITILLFFLYRYNYFSIDSVFGYGLKNSSQITITSINTIKDGAYNTSVDKLGTDGVLVELPDVKIVSMSKEPDGDVHIRVVSPQPNSILETEFTLLSYYYYNASLTNIAVNSSATIVGIPYCDPEHISDRWHGYSCWELHPIVFIVPNSIAIVSNVTIVPEPELAP